MDDSHARAPFFIDMHCHLLPSADDGALTMDESLEAINSAMSQGIGACIVTPHFHPARYQVTAHEVYTKLHELQAACVKNGRTIILYPGNECYYYSGLIDELKAGHALTLCRSSYVLIEFDPDVSYSTVFKAVKSLGEAGYIPILAHFHRYSCLSGRTDRLEEIRYHGGKLQMNFSRLQEEDRFMHKNEWRRLFLKGYVDYLGSDSHGTHFRPYEFNKVRRWLMSEVPAGLRDKVMFRNIEDILRGAGDSSAVVDISKP